VGIHCDDFISLGWDAIGDLTAYTTRDQLKDDVTAKYGNNAKAGALPVWAGLLWRFVQAMKPRDLVVYPRKQDKTIAIGVVDGDYYWQQDAGVHRHRRPVKWLKKGVLRTTFSQGALYKVGSAVTLFRVKNHDQEFRAVVDGKMPTGGAATSTTESTGDEETTAAEDAPDAQRIVETTRDFIVRSLATDFKGHPFAHFTAHLLEAMGHRTKVSPEGPDRGIDIIAHKDPLGLEPPIIKVQCKSTEGKVGSPDVSGLLGTLGHNELGLFVTLGRFTNDALNLGKDRTNLRLIDGQELVDLIFEHYEDFSPEYKRQLPMRRVYVPDTTAA
jgi:restriction system protein